MPLASPYFSGERASAAYAASTSAAASRSNVIAEYTAATTAATAAATARPTVPPDTGRKLTYRLRANDPQTMLDWRAANQIHAPPVSRKPPQLFHTEVS